MALCVRLQVYWSYVDFPVLWIGLDWVGRHGGGASDRRFPWSSSLFGGSSEIEQVPDLFIAAHDMGNHTLSSALT